MSADVNPEAPIYKKVPYEDANAKLRLEVQGASSFGDAQSEMYRATSTAHLPVVTLSQLGETQSLTIRAGHTFSISQDAFNKIVKQFDAKSGKLLSEDDMQIYTDYHTTYDAQTGKRTEGTDYFMGHVQQNDHFDKNGVKESSDSSVGYSKYNSQGKLVSQTLWGPGLGGADFQVADHQYKPDGTETIVYTYPAPGATKPPSVEVRRPDGRVVDVIFDQKTHKPSEVREAGADGVHFFNIDEGTGKASENYWHDLTIPF